MLDQSLLSSLPAPVNPQDLLCSTGVHFGQTPDRGEIFIESALPEMTPALTAFCLQIRDEWTQHLKGRSGSFSFLIPADPKGIPRLYVAVRFINTEDLWNGYGVTDREDFDLLMDAVQVVVSQIVESGLIDPRQPSIEIIAEPLASSGELRAGHIKDMAVAVSTWLDYQGTPILRNAFWWNPESGSWGKC